MKKAWHRRLCTCFTRYRTLILADIFHCDPHQRLYGAATSCALKFIRHTIKSAVRMTPLNKQ